MLNDNRKQISHHTHREVWREVMDCRLRWLNLFCRSLELFWVSPGFPSAFFSSILSRWRGFRRLVLFLLWAWEFLGLLFIGKETSDPEINTQGNLHSCQGRGHVGLTNYSILGSSFMSILERFGQVHNAFWEKEPWKKSLGTWFLSWICLCCGQVVCRWP